MDKKTNKGFWVTYIGFLIFSVISFSLTKSAALAGTGMGGAVIMTLAYLSCGAALRYWFHKNPLGGKQRIEK